MERVSGYIATDGSFFTTAEACRAHEEEIERTTGMASRAKAVVECFSQGTFLSKKTWDDSLLPAPLLEFIAAIPEEDLEDLWNNQIMHLFLVEERRVSEDEFRKALYQIPASGGSRKANDWDYFVLRCEAAYRLLDFVLNKTP
jgi:hypothetical protein